MSDRQPVVISVSDPPLEDEEHNNINHNDFFGSTQDQTSLAPKINPVEKHTKPTNAQLILIYSPNKHKIQLLVKNKNFLKKKMDV